MGGAPRRDAWARIAVPAAEAASIPGGRRVDRPRAGRQCRLTPLKSLANAARGPPSAVTTPAAWPRLQALKRRKPIEPKSASAEKFRLPPGTQAPVKALYVLSTGVLIPLPRPVDWRPGSRIGSRLTVPGTAERRV